MTGEWKPGDVALCVWKDYPPTYALQRPNGRWEDFEGAIGTDLVSEFRRLVVIDPEDTREVEALASLIGQWTDRVPYTDMRKPGDLTPLTAVQAALREFADPKPRPVCSATLVYGGVRFDCERDPDHDADHRNDSIGQGVRWSA